VLLVRDWDEVAEGTLHHRHNAARSDSPHYAKTTGSECDTEELLLRKAPPAGLNGKEDQGDVEWDGNGMDALNGGSVVARSSLRRHAEPGRSERETMGAHRKAKTDENKEEREDEDVLLVGEYDPEAEEEVQPFVLPLPATGRGESTGQASHFDGQGSSPLFRGKKILLYPRWS